MKVKMKMKITLPTHPVGRSLVQQVTIRQNHQRSERKEV
jgi:hypothetical protein